MSREKDMKNYNVKIEDDKSGHKNFIVSVENESDFIEWYNILSNFEKKEKISFTEMCVDVEDESR